MLSVVVPVFNEMATLPAIFDRIRAVPIRKEIVFVDDCSTDDSRSVLERLRDTTADDPDNRLTLVFHDKNRGKGAALRSGFARASGDVVLVQDADLEYDPAEYPRLLQPLVEGRSDVVFGSRFLGDQPHRVLYFWHYLGNRVLTTLSNCFTNLNLTDMETCYKAIRGELAREVLLPKLRANRFGFEPEVTARLAKAGARVYEVPISYSGRTYAEGKKIGWKDGVAALWHIVKYNLFVR
jgi:glycosyltransferase involved in cell wall biosynthesis